MRAERALRDQIKNRSFPDSRMVFLNGRGNDGIAYLEMWRVPPGADASSIPLRKETGGVETDESEEIHFSLCNHHRRSV